MPVDIVARRRLAPRAHGFPAPLLPAGGAHPPSETEYFDDMHSRESGVVERQKVQALMKEMLKSRSNN
jgi:hypothetical protein